MKNTWPLAAYLACATSSGGCCPNPSSLVLPIQGIQQKTESWCTLASLEVVTKYLKSYEADQCQIADRYLCRNDCCTPPGVPPPVECDYPQSPKEKVDGYDWKFRYRDRHTEKMIATEVAEDRPVLIVLSGSAEHMVVGSGYYQLSDGAALVETWDPFTVEFGWRRMSQGIDGFVPKYFYWDFRPNSKGPIECPPAPTNGTIANLAALTTAPAANLTGPTHSTDDEALEGVKRVLKSLASLRALSVGYSEASDDVESIVFDDESGLPLNRSTAGGSSGDVMSLRFRFGARRKSGAFAYVRNDRGQRRLVAVEGSTRTAAYDKVMMLTPRKHAIRLISLPGERAYFLMTKDALVNLHPKNGRFKRERYELKDLPVEDPEFQLLRRILGKNGIPLKFNPGPQ